MGLHEIRGTSTSETTVGSTVTQKTINDSHPELEYYVDTNRNLSKLYYNAANDEDYLKATSYSTDRRNQCRRPQRLQ